MLATVNSYFKSWHKFTHKEGLFLHIFQYINVLIKEYQQQ